LIPGGSKLANPFQYRRNQEFSIVSSITLNCNDSLSITKQWIVKNCSTTICSIEILLDPIIVTTSSELYIPAKKLPFGVYELQLTVIIMSRYPWLKSSSLVYVQIAPSDITVNLVPLGTSMITSGYGQDLLLDPGTYSIDLNEDSFDSSVSLYYYSQVFLLKLFLI